MEEDSGVKAPVTRLRRRLSVEQPDDVKSPASATPTKKRGGRLAAKPQLDLIDENAPTPGSATKRTTRKTSVKEVTEAEEKPVTPSRRSTRIKSNTSIVSETTQSYDSPRAKRAAARRNSQIGSDSEAPITPAKTTRRTRKDSASSVEKLEVTLATKPSNITEVIIEETESIKSDDTTKEAENTTTPTRRSPRIKGKKDADKSLNKSTDKNVAEPVESTKSATKEKLNDSKQNLKPEPLPEIFENKNIDSPKIKESKTQSLEKPNENVSESSFLMVKDLDKKPRKISSHLNKSTSALDDNIFKSKRHRTKSWTITSHVQVDEGVFYSDNESAKKKSKKKALKETKNELKMGSGDHVNISTKEKSTLQLFDKKSHDTSIQNNVQSESFSSTKSRISKGILTPNKSKNTSITEENISPQGNKENIQDSIESAKFFEKAPATILQSTVFFTDSDTDTKGKETQVDTEDQCVPVVDNKLVELVPESSERDKQLQNNSVLNNSNDKNFDDGYEPMDIDETIPNVSVSESNVNKTSDIQIQNSKDKSVINSPLIDKSLNKSPNKSKRKSSINISNNQNLEKIENKSTLILSQIKDVSSSEHNASKSPIDNNELSKSVCSVSIVKDKVQDKINLSQDYSTSTPLQQKKFQKLGIPINSSIIETSTPESKTIQNKSKNNISQKSESSESTSKDDSEDEVDSSRPKNSLIDDEAEDASDDYESGDSQDDEERQYEKQNEIVERGETLDSDDEVSNDTDYEKDSFVVSSDDEDNDLLSGSGDDLSMSDNELSMSRKSKDKYNERKSKDQKKASREMYEARHMLDSADASLKSKKSKRQKIESSEESSEEETIAPVRRNKLRLDSTQDESLNKTNNAKNSKQAKKSKRMRLSESLCDENANIEHEITVHGEVQNPGDPLSTQIKLEPKTPMKDLDISTVQINDNIEQVCVENNVSVLKSTENVDPLQATMMEEYDSSMSENSEIMNNYDSVLKDLNNDKPRNVKSHDMSLNLNKKTKKHSKQPVIDQLNITNTKGSKKKKVPAGSDEVDSAQLNKSANKKDSFVNEFDDSSSDSIDLQLLFSEDSNDFDAGQKSVPSKDTGNNNKAEDFTPLKRTPGNTNILATKDKTNISESEMLNDSMKNKKRSSKIASEEKPNNVSTNDNIQIIVDTQGTRSMNKSLNVSLNTSSKKKSKKTNVTLDVAELSEFNVSTLESTKSKKKQKKLSESQIEEQPQVYENEDDEAPEEVKTTTSKKNNRKSSEVSTSNFGDEEVPEEIAYESTKKKSRKSSESKPEDGPSNEVTKVADNSINSSRLTESEKKKNKKLSITLEDLVSKAVTDKLAPNNTNEEEAPEEVPYENTKTKKNRKSSESKPEVQSNDVTNSADRSVNSSMVTESAKKKKKLSLTVEDFEGNLLATNVSHGSAQKNKNPNNSQTAIKDTNGNVEETLESSKKRKRKSSSNYDNVNSDGQATQVPDDMFSGSQKKKRKISQNDDYVQITEGNTKDGSQKKKNKSNVIAIEPVVDTQDSEPKKKNKKRKERDDDDANNTNKIFKGNPINKGQVTRLPPSLINQLNDKPKKETLTNKKSSVISTTPFVVDDTRKRRNKPSTFLEESVYLNDTHVESKPKANIKKPKVLPFIPTAVTSGSGFTTNFKINVIPKEVQFVAQTTNVANFKNDYLYGKKIKRMGTYEAYKKHRSAKMSKF